MSSATALKTQDEKMGSLGLEKKIVNEDKVCCYSRNLGDVSEKNPVLVLIHGYPQSSYMWRHVISLLPSLPLFVPDLPGYGASAPLASHDKLSVGTAIVKALNSEVKRVSGSSFDRDIPVVLIGHDRGARVAHRLAVSGGQGIDIQSVCLIDIVPTSTQWQHEASPANAAKEITGYFHWPFLANVSLATRMISAFGPGKFCREMIESWSGNSPSGTKSLEEGDALDVYAAFFEQESVLKASCEDYEAGAGVDLEMQEKDQKADRKISCPLLVIFSESGIGARYKFPQVWDDWVEKDVKISRHALGNGIGHFGAEEAPEESVQVIKRWLDSVAEGMRAA